MWNSLRTRLLLATILIVLIAVGVTATVATQRTIGEFERYQERRPPVDVRRIGYLLARSYTANDGWDRVQGDIEQLGQFAGQRVVLADGTGTVVGDSENGLVGKQADAGWTRAGVPISLDGRVIGVLYLDPLRSRADPEQAFLSAVRRSVIFGALAAGLAALIVTFGLAGGILGPIQRLRVAAERMSQGDLTVRVPEEPRDEIGQLAVAFNTMAGSLAEQEQLRRNMVNDVAHELRTPLTNLRGYLEAARDGLVQPDTALVDNLYEETMLLNRLVRDLQELALADAGRLNLQRAPVALSSIIDQAVTISRPQAEARGLLLDVAVPAHLPVLEVDQGRVGQVLRNLLSNSFAYTPAGGKVTLSAEVSDREVTISVTDTGEGIPPESLPHVFERFYRVDESRARHTGGAGLGLAIVKQLVEAHGGRVWVESSGEGSRFSFALPRTQPQSG
jgi:signal transduction histidine kinase